MKRSGNLKRDTPKSKAWVDGPRKPLKKGEPLKARGRNYAEKRKRNFGDKAVFVREQSCDTCNAPPPCDPSHYPSRGAGGTSEHLFPQCRKCHDLMHYLGVETYLAGIDRTRGWLHRRTRHWEHKWRDAA